MTGSRESGTRQTGSEPIGGLAAARLHLDLLRRPLATFEAIAALGRPVVIVGVPFRSAARRVVFVFGSEANRAVLSDPETCRTTGQGLSGPRGSALRRIRNGLTRTRGDEHRALRALLLPKLQRRAIEGMAPRIATILDEELGTWRPDTTMDLGRATKALSLRIASELLFGIGDRAEAAAIGAGLGDFMRGSYRLDVLATRWLGRLPGTPYAALERRAGQLESIVRRTIEARRRRPGDDLLSTLIAARDAGIGGLDDEGLVGQVTLLFGASYETTAQALLFTLALLAQSPAEALRLRETGRSPFAENVVRESLRLLPPVPYTIRIVRRDLELAGAALRRGDRILVSHFLAHRDPALFPEPECFRPDRWTTARPGPYEYFPFSAAPRLCIGAGFASEVLEQAVVEIVRRFDFHLPDGLAVEPAVRVTLGPAGIVPLVLDAPKGAFRSARLAGGLGRLWQRAGDPASTAERSDPAGTRSLD